MRIIAREEFVTMPWANGGGVTHEIAREEVEGRLLWRLSIAEVAEDGAFSRFAGLARVLTVIEGAGMVLETPEGDLQALPDLPVNFSGDTPVMARWIDGPLRDFNVIHDPRKISAEVRAIGGAHSFKGQAGGFLDAVLCIAGEATVNGIELSTGAVALGKAMAVHLGAGARAVIVEMRRQDGIKAQ